MKEPRSIQIWNPRTQRLEVEKVYGEASVRWMYETAIGRFLGETALSRRWMSQLYGSYQSTGLSRSKIQPFIEKFQVPMDEFVVESYASFNEFFVRRFKLGARSFPSNPSVMGAFAEGRYFAFADLNESTRLQVKGVELDPVRFLSDGTASRDRLAREFLGGSAWIARLCPVDYHRYHYPDSGKTSLSYPIHGPLHSVNPIALEADSAILLKNERRVAILETENFGRLAYVEVGATMVGRIEQTFSETQAFERGAEKGYFLFGGSTVVLMAQSRARDPRAPVPSSDLLNRSGEGTETLLRLGDPISEG